MYLNFLSTFSLQVQLQPGEFIGQTVEASIPYFATKTHQIAVRQHYRLTSFTCFKDDNARSAVIKKNFDSVRGEVGRAIKRYPNIYS